MRERCQVNLFDELIVTMNLRQRRYSTCGRDEIHAPPPPHPILPEVYNIIPIHNLTSEHPTLRYTEVSAAVAALRHVSDLRKPPLYAWQSHMDLMDWLGYFFGFQDANVRNQREHLVLHLANAQMRLNTSPTSSDTLDPDVLRRFHCKLLHNYSSWCSFLGHRSQVILSRDRDGTAVRRELLYVSLFLLIWGESANLRFVPECVCYIYHHMAMELNYILDGKRDDNTGRPFIPSISGDCAFLEKVVTPIYETIKAETESSRNGRAPYSAWRNYDDINEYFWSRRCFRSLKWPIDVSSKFFVATRKGMGVGKTGFAEQRFFWNVLRSFDRVWIMLILFWQAAVIVAWEGDEFPWQALDRRDVQVKLLSVFITWGGLRFLKSMLDAVTQYSLVLREMTWLSLRMVLKSVVASTWTAGFWVLYGRIWSQKNADRGWSDEANRRVVTFLEAVVVFVIPELLSIALFVHPGIRNLIEESDRPVVHICTWWFHTRIFVGRGLREGLVDNVKNSLFWIALLVSKFSFSYFLQIKPLVGPTMVLLKLRRVDYNWHEFFGGTNRLAVVSLWVPVVFIYLMDLQIWYSILSSAVGATIGFFSNLGEIRNIEELRVRFKFFAYAMQFNLVPEEREHLVSPSATLLRKLRDAMHRLKLRYGVDQAYKKVESSQVETTRLAMIWNEIILSFREEDIISDREHQLLELPPNCWNIRVVRWPCILLCNELLLALSEATELADGPDRRLWLKICKNDYGRCAVLEAYDSIKYLLLTVVKNGTEENSIVSTLFTEIENYMHIEKMTEVYKLSVLPKIHSKLISLVELLMDPKKDRSKAVNILQTLYEFYVREFPRMRRSATQLRQEGLAPRSSTSDKGLLFENALDFPDAEDHFFNRQLRRLHTILSSRDSMHSVPVNMEARRRIAFFSNSLFKNMPRAPCVEKMLAFSVLTPYCDEEVMYSREMLRRQNEDGISTLFYLQMIYDDEWKNFMERMRREGLEEDDSIWTQKTRELCLWASYRGQTLSRTVRGMMYCYRALKMLAFLDSASEMDIRMGTQELASYGSRSHASGTDASLLFKGHEFGTALMKFTYVVTCRMYGQLKASQDERAEEISILLKNNDALRVAYVDEVDLGRNGVQYNSVLVKYDQELEREVEIYRIRLPGPWKLGEGKPENQNHAIIFTRGDAVQTIDVNQDNYFEEALKIRNLLEEFNNHNGIRKPTILGVRENIFSGSVSSFASFMSAQETSFVTLGQRVRMHYGYPDVFDRFWFLPRGGISKASKVINISEDIFAGFNCTLRGGNVTHHEYIQVVKGRDVGFNQISTSEAKIASGSGEQVLSRDVYRLGHRLDFFRMLSFFYSTVGFYFDSLMVVLTVYTFLWGRLYLALSGIEKAAMSSSNNTALGTILNQQFVVQLGLLTALPMFVENSLEHGFLPAVWDILTKQLQLASFFHTFSLGTRAHYFGRTILHGSAKYQATGRGFVIEHKKFAENYRLYSRSHFVKAIELGVILIVYAFHSPLAEHTYVYIAMSITSWFLVVSWILSPFVFNPSGFNWLNIVSGFNDFLNWLWYNGGFTKADQSWETWWYEEQDHLRKTGLWGKLLEIILDLRFFFFQYGIVYHLQITGAHTSIAVYLLSWIVPIGVFVILAYAQDKYAAEYHIYYRLIQLLVIVLIVLGAVVSLKFTRFQFFDLVTSLLAFIPTGWGLILIAQVLRSFLQSTVIWDTVVSLARMYDLLFGVIVLAPVALLAWLPGFQEMQTRILFTEAFSRNLQNYRILTGEKWN